MANRGWAEWAFWVFGAASWGIVVWVCLLLPEGVVRYSLFGAALVYGLVVMAVLRRLRAIRRDKVEAHDDRDGLGNDGGE